MRFNQFAISAQPLKTNKSAVQTQTSPPPHKLSTLECTMYTPKYLFIYDTKWQDLQKCYV